MLVSQVKTAVALYRGIAIAYVIMHLYWAFAMSLPWLQVHNLRCSTMSCMQAQDFPKTGIPTIWQFGVLEGSNTGKQSSHRQAIDCTAGAWLAVAAQVC